MLPLRCNPSQSPTVEQGRLSCSVCQQPLTGFCLLSRSMSGNRVAVRFCGMQCYDEWLEQENLPPFGS
jgi:hypothetical protein